MSSSAPLIDGTCPSYSDDGLSDSDCDSDSSEEEGEQVSPPQHRSGIGSRRGSLIIKGKAIKALEEQQRKEHWSAQRRGNKDVDSQGGYGGGSVPSGWVPSRSPQHGGGDAATYYHRMAVRSSRPDTPPNEIVRRAAFMLMSTLTCGAGLIWSAMYFALGETVAAIFPTSYSVLMTACFLVCTREGRYHDIVAFQLFLILVLPICLQISVGGIVKAGGVMMWSFLCPLGAALFCRPGTAKRWFGVYLLSMIGTILNELRISAHATEPVVLGKLEVAFFLMNVCGAMSITFLGALLFSIKLDEEYGRSEDLLHNILPRSIAKRLKEGECHIVDNFDGATILFADLVGFTTASAEMHPNFLIGMFLRDVFSAWDEICTERQLEKIKTIGDAFMAVGGLAEDTVGVGGSHIAEKIVLLGLEMKEALEVVNERYNLDFKVRIGIHSGPVIAGVIGVKKFAFDVWGDAVNTASRMESHGIPGCIQISSQTYSLIQHLDYLEFTCCGEIDVKGKGTMTTFLVKRRYEKEKSGGGGSPASLRNRGSNPQGDSTIRGGGSAMMV